MSKYKCVICGRSHASKKRKYCKLHDFWYDSDLKKCPRHVLAARYGSHKMKVIK